MAAGSVDGHWRAILPDTKETDDMKTLFVTITLAIAALSFSQEAFAYNCTTNCNSDRTWCSTNCW